MSPRRLTEPPRTCEVEDAPLARFAGISPEGEKLGGVGWVRLCLRLLYTQPQGPRKPGRRAACNHLNMVFGREREGGASGTEAASPGVLPLLRKEFFDEKGKV